MKTVFISLIFCFAISISVCGQSLTVNISGIDNAKGNISLAFFTSQKEFDTEIPKFAKIVSKKNMKDGCISVTFTDIPAGKYGIALLDDENCNGVLDYKIFVPVEGFGFSNFTSSGLSKPEYNQFCFAIGQEKKSIIIKVRNL